MPDEYQAEFNDGRTAARHQATIVPDHSGLTIIHQSDGERRHWTYDELRLIDPPRRNAPVRLTSGSEPDARLHIDDGQFQEALRRRAPHLFLRGLARPQVRRNTAVIVLMLLAIGLFLWQGVPLLSAPLAKLVPPQWEETIGSAIRARLIGDAAVCTGGLGESALSRITDRLTQNMSSPPNFRITVAERDMVNAFAMPGGNIVIFDGLLRKAETAEEVAAVLAHEIGHVHHRHPTQMAIRATGIGIVADLLLGDGSTVGELAGELGGLLLLLSYSRDMERQADDFGRDLLRRSDIPTGAMASFFARLRSTASAGDDNDILGYFSSHPPLDERIANSAGGDSGRPVLTETEWRTLQKICD